jgi:3-deoxy-7-phosphoheptulonate synthase
MTVLNEAEHVRDVLLAKNEKVDLQAAKHLAQIAMIRDEQLQIARAQLGYDEEPADIGDLVNTRIDGEIMPLFVPRDLDEVLPVTEASAETTRRGRKEMGEILSHKDDRLVVVTGPCSVHDPEEAIEYASHVVDWQQEYGEWLQIIMRTYVEKPRTLADWKGLTQDPYLNGSEDVNTGVIATRLFLRYVTGMGVATITERLNPILAQYSNGLVTSEVAGARNSEDQNARSFASGVSSVFGLKHNTAGNMKSGAQGLVAVANRHAFVGMNLDGQVARFTTIGNPEAYMILRGANGEPNYGPEYVEQARAELRDHKLQESLIVDASHENSGKKHDKQMDVVESVAKQVAAGQNAIRGIMIESYLEEGKQKLVPGQLKAGVSVTDSCVNLADTQLMLEELSNGVRARRS